MFLKFDQIRMRLAAIFFVIGIAASGVFAQSGTVEKVWIEYGAKVRGETGIRIHTKFSVNGAKDVSCSVYAHVTRVDGRSMAFKSTTHTVKNGKQDATITYNTYASKDGKQVTMASGFTPPYDPSTYPDTKLFIPYWALQLGENDPNKMKVTIVLLANGKEFARSTPLEFSRPIGKS